MRNENTLCSLGALRVLGGRNRFRNGNWLGLVAKGFSTARSAKMRQENTLRSLGALRVLGGRNRFRNGKKRRMVVI
ncbi:MAG: hypothetical protein R3A44_23705 [Caldilineaceae bacterium]